jgi:hypothetical protein
MDLGFVGEQTLGHAGGYHGPSWASPEEGRRLVEAFLRVERRDLREEVFRLIEEMLRRQQMEASAARARDERRLAVSGGG